MTIKNVLVKPVLKVSDRQWRKLMARIFEREQATSRKATQLGLEGPKPELNDASLMSMEEEALRAPGYEYDFQPNEVVKWRLPGLDDRVRPPREPRIEPLPGHKMGGELTGPLAEFDKLPFSATKPPLTNLSALEYPVGESRRWKFGMGQSEDMARALAERGRGLELPEFQARGRTPIKSHLTPTDRSGMPKAREVKKPLRSTLLKPGATLPPNMQKAVQKGGHLPTAAEMMTFKPPVTRKYGRLIEQTEQGPTPRSLPWAGAAKLLKKMPGRFSEHTGSTPPADVLRLRERGKSTYERRVFRPLTSDVERATRNSELVAKEQERAAKLLEKQRAKESKTVGVTAEHLEQARPEYRKGVDRVKEVQAVDKDRLWKEALLADSVWKNYVGGMRTLTGRTWKDFLEAEARKKSSIRLDNTTPRDFFQIVLLKYLHEPEAAVAKRYGQQVVNSIKRILAEVEKEHGPLFGQ